MHFYQLLTFIVDHLNYRPSRAKCFFLVFNHLVFKWLSTSMPSGFSLFFQLVFDFPSCPSKLYR